MSSFDPHKYGPVFSELLANDRNRSLDEGKPACKCHAALNALSVETAFAHTAVHDSAMARCCIAGVWLLCDYLDESHVISQGIDTPSGSLWHAIMHRREGDFSNAKYWLHRVGRHPIFDQMAALQGQGVWDPCDFVDECQRAVRGGGGEVDRLRKVQQQEWESLFDYCYDAAIGS